MKKKFQKIMFYFLVCMPFIDFITSIATWNHYPSLGVFIKGILLIYALYYLFKYSKHHKVDLFLYLGMGLYSLIHIYLLYRLNSSLLFDSISTLIKIFYLPILILFFYRYDNPYINRKCMTYISLFYLLLYLVPYLFGLGHNMNEIYPNKDMYLSYFYIGNELANNFIILIPIALSYLIEEKKKYLIPYLLLVLGMIILLGTKTMYISIFVIMIYFIFYYRQRIGNVFKKKWYYFISGIIIIITLFIVILPRTSIYKNMNTVFHYYQVDSIDDVFTLEKIDEVVFSNRLSNLKTIHEIYDQSSLSTKLFGLGRARINEIKDIEIDIFDIFYSIGIIGFILYIGYFIYVFKQVKIKKLYRFIFIFLIIISLFAGHILANPMVSTYLAMLFGVSKNEKERLK